MPSTRRALLRASALAVSGTLAGCSGDRESAGPRSSRTDRSQTPSETPSETLSKTDSTTRETTAASAERATPEAVAFSHRSPIWSSGIADAESRYYARVVSNDREVDRIDLARLRGEVPDGKRDAVDRLISETDFGAAALIALQVEFPSPGRRLSFDFVDRDATPPQVVCRVESRPDSETERGISTVLVRVLEPKSAEFVGTVADFTDAGYGDRPRRIRTFAPPNDAVFESARVVLRGGSDVPLGRSGGALVTTPDAAKRLAPEDAAFADFVRDVDFDGSYVVAVRRSVDSGDYLWPQSVERTGSWVDATFRLQGYKTGLNSVDETLTLARVPGGAPERGSATLRRYFPDAPGEVADTATVRLSGDSDDWRSPGSTTRGDGNRS